MAEFGPAFEFLLGHEGQRFFSNDKTGEKSRFGLTLTTLEYWEPGMGWNEEKIRNLILGHARALYEAHLWEPSQYVNLHSQAVANKVFDLSVHMGSATAIRLLQQVVGAKTDGLLGPNTAAAANATDENELLRALAMLAEQRYRTIVKQRPSDEKFLNGWVARAWDAVPKEVEEV